MTATSGIGYGGGLRGGRVFELNTNGRIKGTSPSVAYVGVQLKGWKNYNLTIPKMRKLNHIDADRVAAIDKLPPTEGASATATISADNMVMDALVTSVKTRAIGEATSIGALTSKQGFEPLVGLWLYQEQLDAATRLRTWRNLIENRVWLIPQDAGMADREVDGTYDVIFTPSTTDLFGTTLTDAADGEIDEQYRRMMSQGIVGIAAWLGDGYVDTFTFSTAYPGLTLPALTTAKVHVTLNGVIQVSPTDITVTTTQVVFAAPPDLNDDVCIKWEY